MTDHKMPINHFYGPDRPQIIFPTRSGKMTFYIEMIFKDEHPKGVIQGEVVTDSGELESGETNG